MKVHLSSLAAIGGVVFASCGSLLAATTISRTVAPSDVGTTGSAFNGADGGIHGDLTSGAPGFGNSSFGPNVNGATTHDSDFQISLTTLFGRPLTINDLSSITYNTKNLSGTTLDWSLRIYAIAPGSGDTFYTDRFDTPYPGPASANWTLWSTDSNNKITNIQHHGGAATGVNDSLTDLHSNYGTETINYISLITGNSGNTTAINSLLDGVVINLTDGSSATLDLVPEPASAMLLIGAAGGMLLRRRSRAK